MAVKVTNNIEYDLGKSLLLENEDIQFSSAKVTVAGAIAIDEKMRILPLISAFLYRCLSTYQISYKTAKTYGKNLTYLVSYLKTKKEFQAFCLDDCLLYVQASAILEYFNHLRRDKLLTTQTIRNRDASYAAFFTQFLCNSIGNKSPLRKDNPYRNGLLSISAKSRIIEMCELNEIYGLMRCTNLERERTLLQFMIDSGLRCSEIPRITKSTIDDALAPARNIFIDDNTIAIPSKYKKLHILGSKGRGREYKPRVTLLSEATLLRVRRYHASLLYKRHSRKYPDKAKPAFLNSIGTPFTNNSISKLLKRVSARAIKRSYIQRLITPHMLRHGFAGMILRSPDLGRDALDRLVTCQHCLGHENLKTTQKYTMIPYEIYGALVSNDGKIYKRYELMDQLSQKTRLIIDLKACK